VGVVSVVVGRDLNIVADHEEQGREEDKEDVGADDFALKLINIIIRFFHAAVKEEKKIATNKNTGI
jgi:hypothetical protein